MTPEQQFQRFAEHADVAALGAVFDALAPELLLVAAHLVGTDAEDLVQATFLDAIEKAAHWDRSRRLLPWLIGILVNHGRAERRRRQRRLAAERLPTREEPSPVDVLAADELAEQLAEGLRELPRQLRQTLTLRLVHGLSPAEIAHAMGCPVATAKTRLQRGMEWLRRVLPAGIGAALATLVTARPGLAAVRTAVLARGEAVASASAVGAGVATAVITGGVLMQKVFVAALALLGVGAWFWFDLAPGTVPVVAPAAPQPGAVAATVPSPDAAPAPVASTSRTAVLATAARPGSAALEFVWLGGDEPARDLVVQVQGPDAAPAGYRTDDDGRLLLRDLPAAEYHLSGSKLHHTLHIESGRQTEERIEVEPSLRVEGIVFDGEWRRIAGAAIYRQYFPDRADTAPRRVAVSGADGTFRAAVDRGGYFWAQKQGHAPSPCSTSLDDGTLQLMLVLGQGGGIVRGTVRAANGTIVPAAQVAIVRLEPRDQCAAPVVLSTDERGCFATTELSLGRHLVVVQAPGHAATSMPVDVDGSEQVCDVQLSLGATVQGTVVDAGGAPLAAELTIRPEWAGAQGVWIEALRPLFHLCAQSTATDAAGNYRLDHVPAGAVTIVAGAPRQATTVERELRLQEGSLLRCDLELGRPRQIHGRLLDDRDQSIVDWLVQAWPVGGGAATSAPTGTDGGFVLEGLDADEYVVEARPAGRVTSVPWAVATNVRPGSADLVLRAGTREQDAGWLTGTLLAADGALPQHPPSAWLIVAGESQGRVFPLDLDAAGGFRLGPLPAGRYRVGIRVPEEAAVQLGTHDLAPRQQLDLGTTRLPANGELEVRFASPQGDSARPVEAMVFDRAGNGGMLLPHHDGAFCSGPLPAGVYTLRAWGEDFVLADVPVVVVADRVTATALQVEPAPTVRFELLRPADGEPGERWQATVALRVQDVADQVIAAHSWSLDIVDRHVWRRALRAGNYRFEATVQPSGNTVDGAFVVHGDATGQVVEIRLPVAMTPK